MILPVLQQSYLLYQVGLNRFLRKIKLKRSEVRLGRTLHRAHAPDDVLLLPAFNQVQVEEPVKSENQGTILLCQ